jgi:hypothetical protein
MPGDEELTSFWYFSKNGRRVLLGDGTDDAAVEAGEEVGCELGVPGVSGGDRSR